MSEAGCTATKCAHCSKNLCSCLFSHIGLSGLVIAYTILGGFLFCIIEVDTERATKLEMIALRNETEQKFLQLFSYHINEENKTLESIRKLLTWHEKKLLDKTFESGWNGRYPVDDLNWSYAGSLLYSVTVITTIGYGHVTPKTIMGRIVTIFYALFGIPLTILYLNNIGDFLAELFQFLYLHMCLPLCRKLNTSSPQPPRHTTTTSEPIRITSRNSPIVTSHYPPLPSSSTVIINHKLTTPTNTTVIGTRSRDESLTPPPPPPKRTLNHNSTPIGPNSTNHIVVIGTCDQQSFSDHSYDWPNAYETPFPEMRHSYTEPIISMLNHTKVSDWSDLEKLQLQLEQADETDIDTTPFSDKTIALIGPCLEKTQIDSSQFFRSQGISNKSQSRHDGHNTHEDDDDDSDMESVPLTLTLTIMVIYILMGAFLFTLWSKEKNLIHLVKWSYFCFITLSTIGFGDIVPGTTIDDENPKEKIIVSLLYVAIGLPVFAMCFKLMQDEIIKKVKNMARKIGIVKSSNQ